MRRVAQFLAVIAVLAAGLSGNARAAANLQQPKVEYSAESYTEAGDMILRSRVFYAPGKQRMEQNFGGNSSIIISRMDKNLAWVVMPEQKTYMEMSLAEGKKKKEVDLYDCKADLKKLGTETVNGERTTKSRITASCPNEEGYEGTVWVTGDGIMMRLESVTRNGQKVKMELKNLKVARQDPQLFEVPAGYSRFDLGGMFEGLKNFQPPADPEAAEERPRKARKTKDEGRSYTANPGDEGRSYTAKSSDEGRSYTAEQKETGRAYTENPRPRGADPVGDTVNKVKRWLGF